MILSSLYLLLPIVVLSAAVVVIMLVIAFRRDHKTTAVLSLIGLALAFLSVLALAPGSRLPLTPLLVVDGLALFYMGLLFAATFAVVALSYGYLEKHTVYREEFYLLILLATIGGAVLAASSHFASFFLGLEILSVSLYALIAYLRMRQTDVEAGLKYLILAGASSGFLLFGMALVYGETGTMEFARLAAPAAGARNVLVWAGLGMMLIGVGYKLAVVPFHMWTPDVYQGAPAPVTAFVASVSKGAMVALILRLFAGSPLGVSGPVFLFVGAIAIASILVGNLMALLQNNVKRILAYSSISHLGYVLVAFIASGRLAVTAATFYIVAYIVTIVAAFGVITVLSTAERDAESLEDYRGLFWRRPGLAGIFTAALLSLAGIPLTAGFVGKFYVVWAGVGSALWLPLLVVVIGSALGLFYYLRIVVAMYTQPAEGAPAPAIAPVVSLAGGTVLAALTLILVWLGVYPAPLIGIIQRLFS